MKMFYKPLNFFKPLVVFLLINNIVNAQAPNAFSYQGVALDAKGVPVSSKQISLRISILQGSSLGTEVLKETHTPITDKYGQFSVAVGQGTSVSGTISAIQWGSNSHYLKAEIDINGGSSYVSAGSSQLLSVPYAIHAGSAPGTAGQDGKTILNGTIDPISSIGTDGDFYINTTSNKLFGPKASGAWSTGISLVGPKGPAGLSGTGIQNEIINSYTFPNQDDYYWGNAIAFCAGYESGGYSDWHIPTQSEMIALISKYGTSIFPSGNLSYWTSTSITGGLNYPTNNSAPVQPVVMSIGTNDNQGNSIGPLFTQVNQYPFANFNGNNNPTKARIVLVR